MSLCCVCGSPSALFQNWCIWWFIKQSDFANQRQHEWPPTEGEMLTPAYCNSWVSVVWWNSYIFILLVTEKKIAEQVSKSFFFFFVHLYNFDSLYLKVHAWGEILKSRFWLQVKLLAKHITQIGYLSQNLRGTCFPEHQPWFCSKTFILHLLILRLQVLASSFTRSHAFVLSKCIKW